MALLPPASSPACITLPVKGSLQFSLVLLMEKSSWELSSPFCGPVCSDWLTCHAAGQWELKWALQSAGLWQSHPSQGQTTGWVTSATLTNRCKGNHFSVQRALWTLKAVWKIVTQAFLSLLAAMKPIHSPLTHDCGTSFHTGTSLCRPTSATWHSLPPTPAATTWGHLLCHLVTYPSFWWQAEARAGWTAWHSQGLPFGNPSSVLVPTPRKAPLQRPSKQSSQPIHLLSSALPVRISPLLLIPQLPQHHLATRRAHLQAVHITVSMFSAPETERCCGMAAVSLSHCSSEHKSAARASQHWSNNLNSPCLIRWSTK